MDYLIKSITTKILLMKSSKNGKNYICIGRKKNKFVKGNQK
jgi:hypothetical protein